MFHLVFFCGKEYRKQLQLLSLPSSSSLEQEDMLVCYLNECITYVPFYKRIADEKGIDKITSTADLLLFPIISKQDIQDNLDDFTDQRFKSSSYTVTTGGTTGSQTKILMSNCAYSKEWAFVNYYLRTNGVDENSNRICLRGVATGGGKFITYNYLYKEILLSPFKLNSENLVNNFNEILRFNAKWIHGYCSSVSELSRILNENKMKIESIKHILLVSEKLHSDQEKNIRLAFPKAKILTFYGSTERVIFAPKDIISNKFMPSKTYGLTEIINGELVGTGFINKATRLVRYRTGDLASAEVNNSIVDSIVDSIVSIDGRWGKEFMLGRSGAKITMTSLNIHSDVMSDVVRFQFYQVKKGFCTLKLQVDSSFNRSNLAKIVNEFQVKLGDEIIIRPEVVGEIPLSARGKHTFIVSDLNNA
ncbi:hypothetical protein [Vibrio campbellii]|uniref:hypothetical protein n=1 Tax=Vibrio campbellii TaxID=680 RepID=UPI00131559E6|nr:hypothetical protein [Vibrio campbellii]